MERFVKDPHTLRQKRQGPLCLHNDEFAQHRKGLVATPVTLVERTTIDKLLDDFSLYLQQERALAPTTFWNWTGGAFRSNGCPGCRIGAAPCTVALPEAG